jgi:catechol 2,3-dioxygenase-like lactoylglutathione lyase family enzyme
MEIIRVTLPVRDLESVADFYGAVLGLPVDREPHSIKVRVGTTDLRITEDPGAMGDHHLAFLIPAGRYELAKEWLSARTPLLSVDGSDEFEMSAAWNARSLYFQGPDRSILELIMRRDLAGSRTGPFTCDDLLSVSEVGVAVPDVPGTVDRLGRDAGIELYWDEPIGTTFAPVGGIDGMLILVSPERLWFPTDHQRAEQQAILVEATGGRPGRYPIGDHAWLTVRE